MDKLPTEILLDIFSYLSYWDLKYLQLVNRHLKQFLASHNSTTAHLFYKNIALTYTSSSNTTTSSTTTSPKYRINPLFSTIVYSFGHPQNQNNRNDVLFKYRIRFPIVKPQKSTTTVSTKSYNTFKPLSQFPLRKESAVWPPLKKAIVHIQDLPTTSVEIQGSGEVDDCVSVIDVFDGVLRVLRLERGPYRVGGRLVWKQYWNGVKRLNIDGDGVVHFYVELKAF